MNLQSTRVALAFVATTAFGLVAITPAPAAAADSTTSGDGALTAEVPGIRL